MVFVTEYDDGRVHKFDHEGNLLKIFNVPSGYPILMQKNNIIIKFFFTNNQLITIIVIITIM